MFRSRLMARLFLAAAVIIAVTSLVIILVASWKIGDATSRETRRTMESRVRHLFPEVVRVLQEDGESAVTELGRLATASDIGITILDETGKVSIDSRTPAIKGDDQSDRPEVRAMMEGGQPFIIRFSPISGYDTAFYGESATVNGRRLLIRFSIILQTYDEILMALRGATFFGAALSTLLLAIPVYWFAVTLRAPINRMHRKATAAAEGSFGEALMIRSTDEIGDLGKAMDDMCAELSRSIAAANLEHRNLSSILAAMVEGVIAIDAEERVIYLNNHAAGILETTQEHCIGRPLWEVTRKQPISSAILDALKIDTTDTREVRIIGERQDSYIRIYSTSLIGADGRPNGAVVVLQDVTTLRRLADVRRDLVTNVSHQFKTPLTAIKGMAETILESPEMTAEQRNTFLQRILDQSERLANIAHDLLELTRLETRDEEMPRVPQDIREIVRDVFHVLERRGSGNGLLMNYDESEDAVPVTCDRHAITQIAENLIDNAIKYTPAGGTVSVRVHHGDSDAIIEIRDSGIGIDLKEQDRIFERFYRTEYARSLPIKGTGLGLSIVHEIVHSYDGTIEMKSAPGTGCAFTIRLPLQRKLA